MQRLLEDQTLQLPLLCVILTTVNATMLTQQ